MNHFRNLTGKISISQMLPETATLIEDSEKLFIMVLILIHLENQFYGEKECRWKIWANMEKSQIFLGSREQFSSFFPDSL